MGSPSVVATESDREDEAVSPNPGRSNSRPAVKRSPHFQGLIDQADGAGTSPLAIAAGEGDAACAAALLAHPKTRVDARAPESGATPLHLAAELGHTELVAMILAHGAAAPTLPLTEGAMTGATPLYLAAAGGHAACVRALLGHPAVAAVADEPCTAAERTPLQAAEAGGHDECAAALRRPSDKADAEPGAAETDEAPEVA